MATRFIFGNKGGGKSYLSAKWMVEELRSGTRDVVTNLAVDMKGLAAYLETRCPECKGDEWKRVTLLEKEQLKEWYKFRGRGLKLDDASDEDGRKWGLLDWTPCAGRNGVLYLIDEAHIMFNSRSWQDTGRSVLAYLSQSRKLGDEVILISQKPEQVDKQMRGQVDEWVHVVNFAALKFMAMFNLPKRIVWTSYSQLPAGIRKEPAQGRGVLKVEKHGIGSVYDTNAGVGIKGDGGKQGTAPKRKGLPLALVLVIPLLLYGGCNLVQKAITGGAKSLVAKPGSSSGVGSNGVPQVAKGVAGAHGQVQSLGNFTPSAAVITPAALHSVNVQAEIPEPEVFVVGFAKFDGTAKVWLSNGDTYTPEMGLQRVGANSVTIEGKEYRWDRPQSLRTMSFKGAQARVARQAP